MCQKCVDICPVDVIGIPGIKEPAECDLYLKGKGPVYIKDCVGCGTCVDPCPVSAITLEEVGSPVTVNDDCIRCGLCSQTCPWNAIFIAEKYLLNVLKKSNLSLSIPLNVSVVTLV